MMNHLQFETSPYLLQHAHNPVEWYAWKPVAFERAKRENKPILVSIGYSTCHWCHVMERESFENEDIAALMNDYFVNIKVDREERPDIDAIYMEACQISSGSGGWPLNCFLTPEGKPFFAGTYFPPVPAYQRPSWGQVLVHFAKLWREERAKVLEQADKMMALIERNDSVFVKSKSNEWAVSDFQGVENEVFTQKYLDEIFMRMRDDFDRAEGGFGGAPKFPAAMAIQFLLQYQHFTHQPEALEHALFSLDKMILGGIYDQLGGGFARYATDRAWLIPHFEKMLYDNALLISAISDAYKITHKAIYKDCIEQTLAFIEREMTHPLGGFYTAFDADSEGEEGKFYVWQKREIEQVLGVDAGVFCDFYGVTEKGNWEGTNILWCEQELEKFAANHDLEVATLSLKLKNQRAQLFAVRKQRVPPGLDDKIILGWNALMSSAYAAAYTALGEEHYKVCAVRNINFLLEHFYKQGKFLHTWKDGVAKYPAFLDDIAFLIAALIDVYEITFDVKYLTWAEKCAQQVISDFWDEASQLFFYTSIAQTDIVLRKKDLFDNATPSGNSTMALNLQRLGLLVDRSAWSVKARQMLLSMSETIIKYPRSFERWATAAMLQVYSPHEIAIIGDNAYAKAAAINRRFLPNRVLVASDQASTALPLLAGKVAGSEALIYICKNFACQRPVENISETGLF